MCQCRKLIPIVESPDYEVTYLKTKGKSTPDRKTKELLGRGGNGAARRTDYPSQRGTISGKSRGIKRKGMKLLTVFPGP